MTCGSGRPSLKVDGASTSDAGAVTVVLSSPVSTVLYDFRTMTVAANAITANVILDIMPGVRIVGGFAVELEDSPPQGTKSPYNYVMPPISM